ncbi:MAG: acyl-CoA dehydrogenase [Chitinophagales bacterium]|nr:acyl-CoA dehydrogenase [Chitinophagales bacterium]
MAQYVNLDTLRFLLYEVHHAEKLLQYDRYKDFDLSAFDMLLDSAKSWADQDFYPHYRTMDEQPAYFKDGIVHTHPILKKIFKDAGENGWIGMYIDQKDGGLQLPMTISNAIFHILEAANNHIPGYLGLTSGSAHLITSFGSDFLKKTYVPPMLSGQWAGTMALTEPQAGSSLSDITTSATLLDDGTYSIKGQKIFISGGDHEGADNFIHLTLARIDGAPSGTKGISLFVVPQYKVEADGNTTYNHVKAVADFQKMGQRGYSTVHLVYGEDDICHGYLVGEPNMGLKYMFQMMNGARIDVGLSAVSIATAAYYASLQYAQERPQGRKIQSSGKKDTAEGQTLIINHPDVRRMLLLQKVIIEGGLSLLIECSLYNDLAQCDTNETGHNSQLLLELLTPIAKTYPAEMGRVAVNNGLQVLGGYGYCSDFPLQQYLRDIRIMAIYEGTTGIQSMDLLGRKVPMENGQALQLLLAQMIDTIKKVSIYENLAPYGQLFEQSLNKVQRAIEYLTAYAIQGDYEHYLADATIFMELTSNVVIAHQWLKMALAAKKALQSEDRTQTEQFYKAKIHAMQFYFKYELPKTSAALETLLSSDKLTLIEDENEIIF